MVNCRVAEAIWNTRPDVDALNQLHEGCAVAHMGIIMTAVGDDYLQGTMPVDHRTIQPFGLMHGGAAALLLETLASAAANHCVDLETHMCVGLEINCNHLRGVREGVVTGRAQALHVGRASSVWDVRAWDAQQRLVSVGRLTSAVVAL